ncbi:MAG: metallophosphoesterase [Clostridia bacterium]|nr:metallophosphoesterase [Clostridia bacterium]
MNLLWLWITLGIVGAAALIILFVWFNNGCIKTTRYKIELEGAPKNIRIVHLSDLHGKSFSRGNVRLIKKVEKAKPDFIAITGDIIHKYRQRDKEVALALVASLKELASVIYCSGNHEMRGIRYRFLRKSLKEAGATVLDDCSTQISGFCVTGLNCASLKNDTIFKITPKSDIKILLAHEPQYFEKYAEAGYDLVMCGHAHGGQWRIPFTKRGLYAPGQGFMPKYTQGVHKKGKTHMVVSRGLGNSRFPLRLFNRPEVVIIDISVKN